MTARVFAIAILTIAACKKHPTTPAGDGSGSGSGGPVQLTKSMTVSWGMSPAGSSTDVYLAVQDETGKSVSHPLGTYPGTCQSAKPAVDDTLLALVCKDGATGIELDVIARQDRIIITKLRVDDGVQPDYGSREPFTEIAAPVGASIKAGS